MMSVPPESVIVFEDTRYGAEDALNAGMMCVALPVPDEKSEDEIFQKAHYLVGGCPDALNVAEFFRRLDPLL
jgi:beta-phosphoglucomutase-like phosphatase (HAD superfamily)